MSKKLKKQEKNKMAILKSKQLKGMGKKDMEGKMKELKIELMKSKANATKSGSSKIKETKKIIARMLTLNKSDKEALKDI